VKNSSDLIDHQAACRLRFLSPWQNRFAGEKIALVFDRLQYLSHCICNELQRSKRHGRMVSKHPQQPEKWQKNDLFRCLGRFFSPSLPRGFCSLPQSPRWSCSCLRIVVAPLRFKALLPPRRTNA
jgi:hypothetical protein